MAEPAVVPDDVADPAGFVLAACDLREARARAATGAHWRPATSYPYGIWQEDGSGDPGFVSTALATNAAADAVHIAAEANPAHALAEVALWRGIVGRHVKVPPVATDKTMVGMCATCRLPGPTLAVGPVRFPCLDLLAVVAAARAYLTETQ